MKKPKRELKSYVVTRQETVVREYVVDAYDEDEAEKNAQSGVFCGERETLDWEVESVKEDK